MRGPRRASQGSGGAVARGLAAQSRTQQILANWEKDSAQQADDQAKKTRQEELRKSIEKRQIEESLRQSKAKEEQLKKKQAPIIQAQKIESERLAIKEREGERHSRLLRENPSYREQFAKEKAEEKARHEAEEKARREAQAQAQAQELGKRKRDEVEQDNFFSNSLKSFTQWVSPLTFNSGEAFSLPNPFAPKASAPTPETYSPPPISKAPIIIKSKGGEFREGKQVQRPTKIQKTIPETIQIPKSTPTPSDYGQYYLDGLYKRFNNGDNNFNIQTIIKEKDRSVMGGHEQNKVSYLNQSQASTVSVKSFRNEQDKVSYLNQRVAKWEDELSKFGITQTAPKKIQTDGVDSKGNKIKRDDYLIQYGDYLKENIKTLRNEATNNSGSKDRNNKLNHLIAFHYLELAKMVCAGSNGLYNNLTDIPSQYKDFLEYSVENSKFISTDLIQEPISIKTTDLGERALRDIKYLEADIYKELTGKKTNICTLGISVPFDPVAYRNQVKDINKRITRDDNTSQRKSPQQKLDELKERSQAAANRGSLAERYLPRALSEIVSSNSYGQQKQAPLSGVFDRAAPASRSFTQGDARGAYLKPPSGLGYENSSIYPRNQNKNAREDLATLQRLHGRGAGRVMFENGENVPRGRDR